MKLCNFTSKGGARMTNGDRIRQLTDDELAKIIASEFTSELVPFCKNYKKCDAILDSGKIIPEEMCIECALEYLKEEVTK